MMGTAQTIQTGTANLAVCGHPTTTPIR